MTPYFGYGRYDRHYGAWRQIAVKLEALKKQFRSTHVLHTKGVGDSSDTRGQDHYAGNSTLRDVRQHVPAVPG
jgi:hypothetical protein